MSEQPADVVGGPASNPEQGTSRARMITWTGEGAHRLEAVRVVLGARGMRANGAMVAASGADSEPFSASYSLATDEAGLLKRLTVRASTAGGERHVALSRSDDGNWLVERGDGTAREVFAGAVEADLAYSPLFNALPVRRLGMHQRAVDAHELPMVYVSLPDLDVRQVWQSYRTISVGEPSVVEYASGSFLARLTVDADGLVLDYPGLAGRA